MSRRQQQHAQIRAEVKAIARQQMAAQGTAALSLRAIAREMGLTAQALYRYFPSRDDLITALIVDAFTAHGVAVQHAVASVPPDDIAGRLWAFIDAYRAWALDNPLDYQLIYGNPIPEYHAPDDVTGPVAAQATAIGFVTLQEALDRGVLLPPASYRALPDPLQAALITPETLDGHPVSPTVMYLGAMAWATMQGLIMLELFGHIQSIIREPGLFYRHQMADLLQRIGLLSAPSG
jgi:AcrR family transcriptional regulator